MATQSGTGSIQIRDEQALKSRTPLPTCEVVMTAVSYEYQGEAGVVLVHKVVASGLAWGATQIDVAIATPWLTAPTTKSITVASNAWAATFDLRSSPLPYGAAIDVSLDTPAGAVCAAHIKESVLLGPAGTKESRLHPTTGSPAGFDPVRNHLVGGFADRFITSRYYVPLTLSYWLLPPYGKKRLVDMITPVGVNQAIASALVDEIMQDVRRNGRKFQEEYRGKEGVATRELVSLVGRSFANLGERIAAMRGEKVSKKRSGATATRVEGIGLMEFPGGVTFAWPTPDRSGRGDVSTAFDGAQGVIRNANGLTLGIYKGIHHPVINLGWLGIMYYDRLRLRPSGLLAGEQVFSLTLAPGEEVTLTQRSETKRSTKFEEIRDRAMEKTLEFQSVWSTDLSQEATENLSSKFGFNMSTPLGESTPAATAGATAEETYAVSAKQSSKTTQQVTAKFANKATQQHKITFEIKGEVTDEDTAKRVVRNYNPARALTLNYYKLYQKYRAVLERHDAALCMSYCIEDPTQKLRAQLITEINKLSGDPPAVEDCGDAPNKQAGRTESKTLDNQGHIDDASEWPQQAYGEFTLVLPAGHVLVSSPKVKVESWTWGYIDSPDWSSSSEETFYAQGGRVVYAMGSHAGQPGPQTVKVLFNLPARDMNPFQRDWKTGSVTARLDFESAPSDTANNQVQACVDNARTQAENSFSAERVQSLINRLKGHGMELIQQKVLERLFPELAASGVDLDCATLEEVRLWFDWAGMGVEYLPWWLTITGRQHFDDVATALGKLPKEVIAELSLDELFMASYARVYLPIQEGFEKLVVDLWSWDQITDDDRPFIHASIDDFIRWRKNHVGPIALPLPNYEQICNIGTAIGTLSGNDAWQHDWEKPRRRFDVLDEWAMILPTDGVHAEPMLSACSAPDEYRTSGLIGGLADPATGTTTPGG